MNNKPLDTEAGSKSDAGVGAAQLVTCPVCGTAVRIRWGLEPHDHPNTKQECVVSRRSWEFALFIGKHITAALSNLQTAQELAANPKNGERREHGGRG